MFGEPTVLLDEVRRLDDDIQELTCHVNLRGEIRHELFELRKRIVKMGLIAYLHSGVKSELQRIEGRIKNAKKQTSQYQFQGYYRDYYYEDRQ